MLDASVVLQLPPFSLMKAMRRAFVTSPRGEKHRGPRCDAPSSSSYSSGRELSINLHRWSADRRRAMKTPCAGSHSFERSAERSRNGSRVREANRGDRHPTAAHDGDVARGGNGLDVAQRA